MGASELALSRAPLRLSLPLHLSLTLSLSLSLSLSFSLSLSISLSLSLSLSLALSLSLYLSGVSARLDWLVLLSKIKPADPAARPCSWGGGSLLAPHGPSIRGAGVRPALLLTRHQRSARPLAAA